ncbi:MAG TPA: CBS domain-containing protein [Gaiella sp.]|jgi:IMP dehydrogenase|nr:CBS domain-containing protein [Gaiella sp.]
MANVAEILAKKGADVFVIEESESVLTAVEKMLEKDVGALVVTRDGAVAGIFTERDYFRRITVQPHPNRLVPVKEVMSSPVIYVTPETPVQECMTLMTQCRIRYLPVIDGTALAGIVSIGDLVKLHAEEKDVEIRFLHEFIHAR